MKKFRVCLFLCFLMLTGCRGLGGDSPNQRAVAQMLAIDATEVGFQVTARILDETGQPESYTTIQKEGETISDAVASISQALGKELFLRDVRLVLLGEQICEDGIGICRQYLTRGFQIRPRVSLAAAQGEAGNYLAAEDSQKAPVDEILPLLQWSARSPGAGTTVLELDRDMNASDGDGYLPLLSLDVEGQAEITGGLLLHKEKTSHLIGREELEHLYLLLEPKGQTLTVHWENEEASVEVLNRSMKIRAKIQDDIPVFTVSGTYHFRLLEWTGNGDAPDSNTLEQAVRQKVTGDLEKALRFCVFDAGMDPIQLDSILRRDQPAWWREYGEAWRSRRENSVFYLDIRCKAAIQGA